MARCCETSIGQPNSDGVWDFASETIAATIDVGKTGWLDRIELPIRLFPILGPSPPTHGGDLYWSIRQFDSNGLPGSSPSDGLASGFVPGSQITNDPGITINLRSLDLHFEQGQHFALTLTGSGPVLRWLSYQGVDAPQAKTYSF